MLWLVLTYLKRATMYTETKETAFLQKHVKLDNTENVKAGMTLVVGGKTYRVVFVLNNYDLLAIRQEVLH